MPPVPACLEEVTVPDPVAGEAAVIVAARERAGRLEANRRIRCGASLWQEARAALAF